MTDSAPEWTRGIDLGFLKECAAAMRPDIKPHCYGAFGLPKERDIADAHHEGNLIWTRGPDDKICAAAIFRVLVSGSRHSDFADRQASLKAGDLLIRHIAGEPDGREKLMAHLLARHRGVAVWAEVPIENPGLVALLAAHGFERAMTKITASSDLKGLFLRGPHVGRWPQPMARADEPALVQLAADFISEPEREAVLAEVKRFGQWAQHYSTYNKRGSWTAFALHGFDRADPTFIIKPAEMSKGWKADNPDRLNAACGPTIAAQHFPAAMAVVDRLPGTKQRVRLMRLASGGGELTRHADITDPEAGTADGATARLHIPLTTDPACLFRGWDLEGVERRAHFAERALCYLDTRKPHAVINGGAKDRVHLVIDCHSTPALRQLIVAAG